jgi:hypothetical protein
MYKFYLRHGIFDQVVSNGGFDSTDDWFTAQGWDILSGKAVCTGVETSTSLIQYNALILGEEYTFEFTISDYASGGVQVWDGTSNVGGVSFIENGTHSFTFTAGDTDIEIKGLLFEGKVDDVSCTRTTESFTQIYPRYGDQASVKYSKDEGQMFFRKKWNGSFKLAEADYDYISALAFDTKMRVEVTRWNGSGWVNYIDLYFYKTDIEWDDDIKLANINVSTDDHYDDVIDCMTKEYNVIDLAPKAEKLLFSRRPVFQFYGLAHNVVTNYYGGVYWEQVVDEIISDPSDLESIYKFGEPYYVNAVCSGDFIGGDGMYLASGGFTLYTNVDDANWTAELNGSNYWGIYNGATLLATSSTSGEPSPVGLTWSLEPGVSGTIQFYGSGIYGRVICNKSSILNGTISTATLPDPDMLPARANYPKAAPYPAQIYASQSTAISETKYGVVPDGQPNEGEYWVAPTEDAVPINRSEWTDTSWWYIPKADDLEIEQEDGTETILKDAYPLYSVIAKMLEASGVDVTHTNDSDHSTWLYSSTEVADHVPRLYITPTTNITRGPYDQPAAKGFLSLEQIFELYAGTYRAFWTVIAGKLLIELKPFFQNGLSYPATAAEINITARIHPRHGYSWAHLNNKWRYAKVEMPARIESRWMDDCSQPFVGYAIEVNSGYVQKGKVDNRDITAFNADLDFILINPSEISEDGWVVLDAGIDGSDNRVQMVELTVDGQTYVLQNGYLSMVYLHDKFHSFDCPTDNVTINNEAVTLTGNITRYKESQEKFPLTKTEGDPDPTRLIESGIGVGEVSEMEVNLNTRIVTCTLRYDTES